MAQHDDLGVLGAPRPKTQGHELERAPDQQIEQRYEHAVSASGLGRSRYRDGHGVDSAELVYHVAVVGVSLSIIAARIIDPAIG